MNTMEDIRTPAQKQYDDEQMRAAYAEITKYEKEIASHNQKILSDIGGTVFEDFKEMMDCCTITAKIEIVDKPGGENQEESYGIFKEVFVSQWTTTMEGDSFEGYIYARFNDYKWLKITYEC